jgi:hypothetical protein
MNITESIRKELNNEVSAYLNKTSEIQIYANTNIHKYQWCDNRFAETSNVWDNPNYDTRLELKRGLMEYIESKGDFTQ